MKDFQDKGLLCSAASFGNGSGKKKKSANCIFCTIKGEHFEGSVSNFMCNLNHEQPTQITMKSIQNILSILLLSLLTPAVFPELKVKPPAPITGDPVVVEDEAYLAHFSKKSE